MDDVLGAEEVKNEMQLIEPEVQLIGPEKNLSDVPSAVLSAVLIDVPVKELTGK